MSRTEASGVFASDRWILAKRNPAATMGAWCTTDDFPAEERSEGHEQGKGSHLDLAGWLRGRPEPEPGEPAGRGWRVAPRLAGGDEVVARVAGHGGRRRERQQRRVRRGARQRRRRDHGSWKVRSGIPRRVGRRSM